jgi:hypothetical protein
MSILKYGMSFLFILSLIGCGQSKKTKKIVGWGDSMMKGSGGKKSILEVITEELSIPHENFGVGGLKSSNIAILQGGNPLQLVFKDQEIIASEPTEVLYYNTEPINFQTKQFREGSIKDINGKVERLSEKENKRKTIGYTFTAQNIKENVKTQDTVVFKFNDALENNNQWTVIWAGRNDRKSEDEVYKTRDNIQAMIDYMGENAKKHYLVLSICNGIADREYKGSNAHTNIMRLNMVLKEAFGDRFVDVRSYMVNKAIYDMEMTPTPQDLEDIKKDCIPRSFLKDNVHFNTLGYEATGKFVANVIKEKGWIE